MTTTSPEEIERQHQTSADLVQKAPLYPDAPTCQEISLKFKQKPTTHDDDDPVGPCWSSRGRLDVSALADLIRQGYNDNHNTTTNNTSYQDEDAASKKEEKKDDKKTHSTTSKNLWDVGNAAQNNVAMRRPSHDAWGIGKIMLIFADDFLQTTYEFPFWKLFQDHLEPLLQLLQINSNQIVRLLFASLPPNVTIPMHQDSGAWVKQTHRVHVPILVNDPSQVVFSCGHSPETMQRIDCTPGHVFEINNQCYHAVSNCDTNHRVHMILDYTDNTSFHARTLLQPGQVLLQTRRSIDLLCSKGKRPTPSFIILGAQKAGTTSLFEYMMQHPLIIRPKRRETHLFDWRWIAQVTDHKHPTLAQQLQWMHKFFYYSELQNHPSCMTGDSTPSYLLDSRRVIPRIQLLCTWPMQFFVMLRNPIRRAESHYAMVTSLEGTEAQIKARGTEWRDKTFKMVVQQDLEQMKTCGLIPYFDIDSGIVDETMYNEFSYSDQEDKAWDAYLQTIPLNTGSHCLLGRGLYEMNLRPWFKAFGSQQVMVIQLERMEGRVQKIMDTVWKRLGLPQVDIEDTSPKNQRSYESLLDEDMQAYLQRFYQPHNRRLERLLGQEWRDVWEKNN